MATTQTPKNVRRYAYTANGAFTHITVDGTTTACGKECVNVEVQPKGWKWDGVYRPSQCHGACKRY